MIGKIKKELPPPEKILSIHELKEQTEGLSFSPQRNAIYELWKETKAEDKEFLSYSLALMENLSNFDLHEIINERLQIHAHSMGLLKTILLTKDIKLLERCINTLLHSEGNISEVFESINEAAKDIEKLHYICENMERALTKQKGLEERAKTKDWRKEIKKMRETIKKQKQTLANIIGELDRITGQLKKDPVIKEILEPELIRA